VPPAVDTTPVWQEQEELPQTTGLSVSAAPVVQSHWAAHAAQARVTGFTPWQYLASALGVKAPLMPTLQADEVEDTAEPVSQLQDVHFVSSVHEPGTEPEGEVHVQSQEPSTGSQGVSTGLGKLLSVQNRSATEE
jgi:hypothetical protein